MSIGNFRLLLVLLSLLISATILFGPALLDQHSQAQAPTATPVQIVLPTATIAVTEARETATWTPTPTPEGIVVLEPQNEANVRSNPDPESASLGVIRAGESYVVTGRYFEWYRIEFDQSPDGQGWVYGQIVTITGDASQVLDLSVENVPTADDASINATNTIVAAAQIPGGLLTVTADSRQIAAPGSDGTLQPLSGDGTQEVLPTFTYPPNVVAALPTQPPASVSEDSTSSESALPNTVAPIVPILLLGGLGILGLVITGIARR